MLPVTISVRSILLLDSQNSEVCKLKFKLKNPEHHSTCCKVSSLVYWLYWSTLKLSTWLSPLGHVDRACTGGLRLMFLFNAKALTSVRNTGFYFVGFFYLLLLILIFLFLFFVRPSWLSLCSRQSVCYWTLLYHNAIGRPAGDEAGDVNLGGSRGSHEPRFPPEPGDVRRAGHSIRPRRTLMPTLLFNPSCYPAARKPTAPGVPWCIPCCFFLTEWRVVCPLLHTVLCVFCCRSCCFSLAAWYFDCSLQHAIPMVLAASLQ